MDLDESIPVISTDKVYDIKKISKILEKYYEVHDLLDADNHVLVEGALANVVQKFRERDISGSRQPATKVLSLLLANMDPYYILKFGDSGTVKNMWAISCPNCAVFP